MFILYYNKDKFRHKIKKMKIELQSTKSFGISKYEVDVNGNFYCLVKVPGASVAVGETQTSSPITFENQSGNKFCKTDPIVEYTQTSGVVGVARLAKEVTGHGDPRKSQIKFNFSNGSIVVRDDFYDFSDEGSLAEQVTKFIDYKTLIESNGKTYSSRELSNPFFDHIPIYDGDIQIGEVLRVKGLTYQRYCCFLKDEYSGILPEIISLMVFKLFKNKDDETRSLNDPNDNINTGNLNIYDKDWLKNNFGDEYQKEIDQDMALMKKQNKKDSTVITIIASIIAIFCVVFLIIGKNDAKTVAVLIVFIIFYLFFILLVNRDKFSKK